MTFMPYTPPPAKPVHPQRLSADFYRIHHFHVFSPKDTLLGMFATLYCAGQTALHSRNERYVVDMETGAQYVHGYLACLRLESMPKIRFDYSLTALRKADEEKKLAGIYASDGIDEIEA